MSEAQSFLLQYAALFALDQFTLRIASDLLKSAHSSSILKKKPDLRVRCAILVASREVASRNSSSLFEDVKKQDFKKVALTHILSQAPETSICEFSAGLQQFLVILEIETHTIKKLMTITQNCEFAQTLFDKYQILLSRAKLQDYKAIGWILFCLARRTILQSKNDPLESLELLLSVVALLVRSIQEKPESMEGIVSELKDILELPKQGKVEGHHQELKEFLKNLNILEDEMLLDLSEENQKGILDLLNERMNSFEEQDELDDRYFINNPSPRPALQKKQTSMNRVVVTPAAPAKPDIFTKPIPQRVCMQLDFGNTFTVPSFQERDPSHNFGIKLYPKDAIQSPFSQLPKRYSSTPLPTPMTAAILMNSWLLESVKKYSAEGDLPSSMKLLYGDRLHEAVDKVESHVNFLSQIICASKRQVYSQEASQVYTRNIFITRSQQLRGIFFSYVQSILEFESEPHFYEFVGVCAAETILFIKNIQSIGFLTILNECKLHPYQFYSLLDKFMTKNQSAPISLKHHFSVIKERILLEWAWMGDTPLIQELNQTQPKLVDFMNSILESAAQRVLTLCQALQLAEGQDEKVWLVVKYVLREHTSVLFSRHVDQIVLCATYIISGPIAQRQNLPTASFNDILKGYKELKDQSILQAKLIISDVLIEDGKSSDIVDFYNQVFMPLVKDFIYNSQSISMTAQSPSLRECGRVLANRRKSLSIFGGDLGVGMTPRTMALRAPIDERLPKAEERQRKILSQLKEEQEEEEQQQLLGIASEEIPRDSSRMFGKSLLSAHKANS